MILLQSALRETLPRVHDRLGKLIALIDPSWIEQAPAASGKASIMRRKLPAEHTVWLVIGLALFRNCLLWQVVQQLELSLGAQLQDEDQSLTLFNRADFSGQPIAVNSKSSSLKNDASVQAKRRAHQLRHWRGCADFVLLKTELRKKDRVLAKVAALLMLSKNTPSRSRIKHARFEQ